MTTKYQAVVCLVIAALSYSLFAAGFPFSFWGINSSDVSSLNNGLVCYWNMDEASGNRIDEVNAVNLVPFTSTNEFGTGSQVGSGSGLIGNAVTFTPGDFLGIGQLKTTDSTDLNHTEGDDWSISFWIKFNTYSTSNYSTDVQYWITDEFNNVYGSISIQLRSSGSYRCQLFNDAFDDSTVNVPFTPTIGQWHHIVASYNGTTGTVSLQIDNGTIEEAVDSAVLITSTHGLVRLGTLSNEVPNETSVDEVGVWRRLLSEDEKTELYNGGEGNTYPFE